jgi:hypothetical protein
MDLPIHNDQTRTEAEAHLSIWRFAAASWATCPAGHLFAGTQGRGVPKPWRQPQLVLIRGAHEGDLAAGDDVSD